MSTKSKKEEEEFPEENNGPHETGDPFEEFGEPAPFEGSEEEVNYEETSNSTDDNQEQVFKDVHDPNSRAVDESEGLGVALPRAKYAQTRKAKYEYDSMEREKLALELASKNIQKHELEEAKKSSASSYKSQIDEVDSNINQLSKNISNGYEYRNYECNVFLDFDNGLKYYIDKHTGREIDRERMATEDYQLELFK